MNKIRTSLTVSFFICLSTTVLPAANNVPLSLETGIQQLAKEISNSMLEENKRRIAIASFFEPNGKETVLGSYISESLTTELFRQRKFDIYERSLLGQVIGEHKLSLTGTIDPETAKQIGRLIGVDAIVTGTTVEMVDYVGINTRLVSTETGQVFAASRVQILKDSNVKSISDSFSGYENSPTETAESYSPSGRQIQLLNGTYSVIEGNRMYGTSKSTPVTRGGSVTFHIVSIRTDGKSIVLNMTISVAATEKANAPFSFPPKFRADFPQDDVYVTDSLGERYEMTRCEGCKQSSYSEHQSIHVTGGQSVQVSLTFPISAKSEVEGLTLFLGYVNIPFGIGEFIR